MFSIILKLIKHDKYDMRLLLKYATANTILGLNIYKSVQTNSSFLLKKFFSTKNDDGDDGATNTFFTLPYQFPESKPENIKEVVKPVKTRIRIPRPNEMPRRPTVPESDIEEKFIKGGSGKGGQKINKTNSKVQLTHIRTGIVVTSQATRSRDQNRKIAREILAMKIEELERGPESRNQIVIARKQMVKQRAKRKTKSKYRRLEDEKLHEKHKLGDIRIENLEDANNDNDVIIIIEDEIIGR